MTLIFLPPGCDYCPATFNVIYGNLYQIYMINHKHMTDELLVCRACFWEKIGEQYLQTDINSDLCYVCQADLSTLKTTSGIFLEWPDHICFSNLYSFCIGCYESVAPADMIPNY